MTVATPTSVVVTSQGNPDALGRCLRALRLTDHPATELVIVACPAGLEAARRLGLGTHAKAVAWPDGPAATARNLGLRAAAGEVVAFVGATALVEPPWLSRLVATFADPRVEGATGFVRGPCGMMLNRRAAWVDAHAVERPLAVDPATPGLHQGAPGAGVRLWPEAMAFRRETLAALGGFDPAFAGGLDGCDLDLRLAAESLIVAVVPLAQVQQPAVALQDPTSFTRGADRAVFLRKHAPKADPDAVLAALMAMERRRALRAMVEGWIEPRDVGAYVAALRAGFAAGLGREIAPLLPIGAPPEPFRPLPDAGPRPARTFVGWPWASRRLRRTADAAAADGAVVTVLRLSPGAQRRRMAFTASGHWLQTGGVWSRTPGHDDVPARSLRPRVRIRAEITRLAAVRPVDTLLG